MNNFQIQFTNKYSFKKDFYIILILILTIMILILQYMKFLLIFYNKFKKIKTSSEKYNKKISTI